MTIPQEAIEAVQKVLQESEALHCTRDWSAWQHGTMTDEDFVSAAEEPTLIEALIEAAQPHIEADLRAKIAADIRDNPRAYDAPFTSNPSDWIDAFDHGIDYAARIAEGKQ